MRPLPGSHKPAGQRPRAAPLRSSAGAPLEPDYPAPPFSPATAPTAGPAPSSRMLAAGGDSASQVLQAPRPAGPRHEHQRRGFGLLLGLVCAMLIVILFASTFDEQPAAAEGPEQQPRPGQRFLIRLDRLPAGQPETGGQPAEPEAAAGSWWAVLAPQPDPAGRPGARDQAQSLAHAEPAQSIKIMCSILTVNSAANEARSAAVAATWAKRCDKYLLVEGPPVGPRSGPPAGPANATRSEANNTLVVRIELESRDQLWHKVVKTFESIYEHHLNQFDWFMKADDDTYVLMDSLRSFLISKSHPGEPIYFGHRFKPYVRQGYMSGGSGYVLSREAVRRLVELGFRRNLTACNLVGGSVEDIEMGRCLEAVGVKAGDTRDSAGKETFLPLPPQDLMTGRTPDWYSMYNYYNQTEWPGRCSNEPIAFHYIDPGHMYLIDWLLNDVKRRQDN